MNKLVLDHLIKNDYMKPHTLNHILKHALPTRITSSYNFLDALEDIKRINQIVERPIYHIHQRNGKYLIIEDRIRFAHLTSLRFVQQLRCKS